MEKTRTPVNIFLLGNILSPFKEELVESLDTYEKMVGERFLEIFRDCEKMTSIIQAKISNKKS